MVKKKTVARKEAQAQAQAKNENEDGVVEIVSASRVS